MSTARRLLADLITLVRVPIIVLLAAVIDPDQPELACVVGLIGLASLP